MPNAELTPAFVPSTVLITDAPVTPAAAAAFAFALAALALFVLTGETIAKNRCLAHISFHVCSS